MPPVTKARRSLGLFAEILAIALAILMLVAATLFMLSGVSLPP
jgi:hypothetical protein